MWTSLTDMLTGTPMGVTAENLAAKFDVTRSAFQIDFKCAINCKFVKRFKNDSFGSHPSEIMT